MTDPSRLRAALVAALVAIASPLLAAAQTSGGSAHFIGAAGLAMANSNFGQRNESGYSLLIGLAESAAASPLSFRAEGMFSEFDEKGSNRTARALALTANAVVDLGASRNVGLVPYLIGGIGYYNTREPAFFDDDSEASNLGFNLGGGLRFPLSGFSAYIELRYHKVSNADVEFMPLVFGVSF